MRGTFDTSAITRERNDNEPINLVQVTQGGDDLWNDHGEEYLGYRFKTTGYVDDTSVAEKYFKVGLEFAQKLSENKVIGCSAEWLRENSTLKELLNNVEPVYVEDGLIQQFKNELIAENRKDIIWADYAYYDEKATKTFFFSKPKVHRRFNREIYVLQDKFDVPLIERMEKYAWEGYGCVGINIFPENKINQCCTDEETIKHYVHSQNYIIKIGIDKKNANIYMQRNPKYILYDDILAIIKPIFEKYGFEFVSNENPFIKDFHCEARCHDCKSYCMYNLDKTKYIYDRLNVDDRLNPISYEKWRRINIESKDSSSDKQL